MSVPSVPAICYCIFLFFAQAATGLYAANGVEPSPSFIFLDRAGLLCLAVWWLGSDSRKHGVRQPFDIGLLLACAWMLIVPHHLIKTRGRKGLLFILLLAGLFVASYAMAVASYIVFSSFLNP